MRLAVMLSLLPAQPIPSIHGSDQPMIFSRRSIQRMLDQLRPALGDAPVTLLARKLNKVGAGRLAIMWEVAVLHGLSRLGQISYEVPISNGTRPDVTFVDGNGIAFTADITAISDTGNRHRNPFDEFMNLIEVEKRTLGLGVGGVNLKVNEREELTSKGRRRILCLPPREELKKYVHKRILPEIKKQMALGRWPLRISEDTAGVSFDLTIDHGPYSGGSYAAYTLPTSIKKNPLYSALKAKALKLKAASGTKGVFACDADCAALKSDERSVGVVSTDRIVSQVMDDFEWMDFVVILAVKSVTRVHQEVHQIITTVWVRDRRYEELMRILHLVSSAMPVPVNSAVNALHRAKESGFGRGNGGLGMSDHHLEIGARYLLEVLAGRITVDDFNETFGWGGNQRNLGIFGENPFERALREGRLPIHISVEQTGESANDNIVKIEFGNPDAAIKKFY